MSYLSQIIFGLDQATERHVIQLRDLIEKYKIKNQLIQWNDGPGFKSIYDKLNEAGFNIREPGKGKNMFLSFGIAIALGAESVGLVDADIRTFKSYQLDRLYYPVVVLNYDFAKAYYSRIMDKALYGRVKRLLHMLLQILQSLVKPYFCFHYWIKVQDKQLKII